MFHETYASPDQNGKKLLATEISSTPQPRGLRY